MMQRDFCRCGNVVYHNGLHNAKCKCGRSVSSGTHQVSSVICQTKYAPLSAEVTLVTSLSRKPNHLDVQTRCLDSWVNLGCQIVAQNASEEIEQLRSQYPQVHDWVGCDDVSKDYEYPTQRIYRLLETTNGFGTAAAMINSDIELRLTQSMLREFLTRKPSEFVLGIRWNYGTTVSAAREFEWGFDLITITPDQLAALPKNMPYAIGQAMWDYAIPDILRSAGFSPKIPHERVLLHRDHPHHWSEQSHRFGMRWLSAWSGKPFNDVRFRREVDPDWIYNHNLGRYLYNHWQPLHRYASERASDWNPADAKRWYFTDWKPKVASIGCSCQSHWEEITGETNNVPVFSSAKDFFEWGWRMHNEVSRRHSQRPTITLQQAYEIYWVKK